MTLDEKKIAELGAEVARHAMEGFAYQFVQCRRLCESPIEELMLAALIAAGPRAAYCGGSGRPTVSALANPVSSEWFLKGRAWHPFMSRKCTIRPQFQIGEYRVDFCLLFSGAPNDDFFHIVVECDGHEWHERTPEQAGRDKARDRAIQAAGFQVLRFTGREIWGDALRCASEVFGAAEKEWDRRAGGEE